MVPKGSAASMTKEEIEKLRVRENTKWSEMLDHAERLAPGSQAEVGGLREFEPMGDLVANVIRIDRWETVRNAENILVRLRRLYPEEFRN